MPAGSSEHLTIPDVEDAVFQPGAEIGGRNVLRVGVIEVVQHQTEVSGLVDGFDRPARPAAERSGKLLAAQIGRRKTLPFFHPPRHNILELDGVVRRSGIACNVNVVLDSEDSHLITYTQYIHERP